MPPRISVFIPCYNYAHYLPEAVESVLRQSFPDWEAIAIDDASTDATLEVMHSFTDPRIIRIYHNETKGNIATYNEAIALSRGEFVVALSADDRYHPDFFKKTIAMLDAHPEAGMAYTGWEIIDANGRVIRRVGSMPHREDGVYDDLPHLVLGCYIAQCTVVVRRRVYQEVGAFTLSRAGDWDMWLRIARKYPIAFVREPLYQYRRHGRNMSADPDSLKTTEVESALVLSRLLNDPELPAHVAGLANKALAWQQWWFARLRFMRRDWAGGVRAFREAVGGDVTLATSPRRVAGMALAVAQGIVGRAWPGI